MKIFGWGKSNTNPVVMAPPVTSVSETKQEPPSDLLQRLDKRVIDHLSSAIMLVDSDFTITYLNQAAQQLFQRCQHHFKHKIPDFSVATLLDQNLTRLLQVAASNHSMDHLIAAGHLDFVLDSLHFKLVYQPMSHAQGQVKGGMIEWIEQSELLTASKLYHVMSEQQAYIEYDTKGTILHANPRFLAMTGYRLDDIKGQHHNAVLAEDFKTSAEMHQLWRQLAQGQPQSIEYKLNTRSQQQLWFSANYTPILDASGKVFKIIETATDITTEKLMKIDREGQLAAIGLSQAVIEFTLDGIILTANQNFLATVGYSLAEIQGKHHSLFVDEAYKRSQEYQAFWDTLKSGKFFTGEYRRFGKNGQEIWNQASYNPIFDINGKPFKVVKYASNITAKKVVVNEIKRVMMELSNGDLTTEIEQKFDTEFVELGDSISNFIESLRETIADIRNAAETIQTASTEISQGNIDLSSRTEEQASSLEETASSMEQLSGTVRQNADNARQANILAAKASDVALEGGSLIEQVVKTMASINESSQKISDIIGVIDGIAFQTNILALNAAVEAARAGEQGRGFAVVAAEVRTLAQRSANAAKDIKALISDSVNKINNGNELVGKSGHTMREIVTSIQRVNDIMAEIAAASSEQSTGLDEIGKAVTQMDEMTQQNAALVEEAAAAAESLLSQAGQLADTVSRFHLGQFTNQSPLAVAARTKPKAAATKVRATNKAMVKPTKVSRARTTSVSEKTNEDTWQSY